MYENYSRPENFLEFCGKSSMGREELKFQPVFRSYWVSLAMFQCEEVSDLLNQSSHYKTINLINVLRPSTTGADIVSTVLVGLPLTIKGSGDTLY